MDNLDCDNLTSKSCKRQGRQYDSGMAILEDLVRNTSLLKVLTNLEALIYEAEREYESTGDYRSYSYPEVWQHIHTASLIVQNHRRAFQTGEEPYEE